MGCGVLGGPVEAQGSDDGILPGPHLMAGDPCGQSTPDWHRLGGETWQYRSSRGEPRETELSHPENGHIQDLNCSQSCLELSLIVLKKVVLPCGPACPQQHHNVSVSALMRGGLLSMPSAGQISLVERVDLERREIKERRGSIIHKEADRGMH